MAPGPGLFLKCILQQWSSNKGLIHLTSTKGHRHSDQMAATSVLRWRERERKKKRGRETARERLTRQLQGMSCHWRTRTGTPCTFPWLSLSCSHTATGACLWPVNKQWGSGLRINTIGQGQIQQRTNTYRWP